MVAGSEIKGRVCDRVIDGIREAHATVVYFADVGSELDSVISMDPRNIIREIVDGRHPAEKMLLTIGLEHEPKADVIPFTIAANVECLACVAVPEVIYPVVSDRPGVTDGQTPWMIPYLWGNSIRKPLGQRLTVVN